MPPTNAAGLACPHCRGTLTGVDRTRAAAAAVKRRRRCETCGRRFTTVETVLESTSQEMRQSVNEKEEHDG